MEVGVFLYSLTWPGSPGDEVVIFMLVLTEVVSKVSSQVSLRLCFKWYLLVSVF